MSITLRTLKGTALTYEEMDRNLSQYYYSSSLHDSGGTLRLHFTGSTSLDTPSEDYGPDRFHEIQLTGGGGATVSGVSRIIAGSNISISSTLPNGQGDVTITSVGGAGALPQGINGSVQYRVNSTTFGGDESFFYDSVGKKLGLGTTSPQQALHVVGDRGRQATIKIQTDGGIGQTAKVDFYNGNQKLGSVGKTRPDSSEDITKDIFIVADGELGTELSKKPNKIHNQIGSTIIQTVTGTGVGINTQVPNKELTIITPVDSKGIGIGANQSTDQSEIRTITSNIANNLFGGVSGPTSKQGLLLNPPIQNSNGGNLVLGVLDTQIRLDNAGGLTKNAGNSRVSIAAFLAGGSLTQNLPIATFLSNQTVGINTNSPDPKVRLDINGQYRGAYKTQTTYTTLDFNNFSTIKITSSSSGKETVTLNSIPLAGVEGTIILTPSSNHSLEFPTNQFKTLGNLTIESGNYYTIKFISDGSRFIEISRTGPLT